MSRDDHDHPSQISTSTVRETSAHAEPASPDDLAAILSLFSGGGSQQRVQDGAGSIFDRAAGHQQGAHESNASEPVWLLAYTQSGVTWGRAEHGTDAWSLTWSCSEFQSWPTPVVETATVLEFRVFGNGAELLVWRDPDEPDALVGRWIDDPPAGDPSGSGARPEDHTTPRVVFEYAADESRLLLGRVAEKPSQNNFTLLRDGTAGTVVPVAVQHHKGRHQATLAIRHYFQQADTGALEIRASRLVGVQQPQPSDKN